MSSRHLKVGDAKPDLDPTSKFRLYSMLFCPYAQASDDLRFKRPNTSETPSKYASMSNKAVPSMTVTQPTPKRPRLVLAAKEITGYETVNIQLRDTIPEWFSEVNPLNKVPALEFPNGETFCESLVISDYIDELYPKNSLHPSDPMEKAQQRSFVEYCGSTVAPILYKYNAERTDENKQVLLARLSECEKYLVKKKLEFFGGDRPAMVDYMIWPFFERLPIVYELSSELHPKLTTWFNKMHDLPAVKKIAHSKETYKAFYDGYAKGKINYDLAG